MITEAARLLAEAQRTGVPCAPLSDVFKLDPRTAYEIQQVNIEERLLAGYGGRPARIIGYKVGLTSRAIQAWLNVNQPDFGTLLSDMVVLDGDVAPIDRLLQPRAEAEIAFVLGRDLEAGAIVSDVMRAVDYVLPAIEIIDSRIQDWKFTFEDTVADNASSGMFVLGAEPKSLVGLDLRLCGATLSKNGSVVSTGAGVACLGHPLHAVAWLATTLGTMGSGLSAGDVVLSGALGPVTQIARGDALVARINGVGQCSVAFH